MDLRSRKDDDDHVVTPFTQDGRWGCLSVSNHSSLRYRNPVYKTLRELAMSYFDDYMNGAGERTLRAYSRVRLPIDQQMHALTTVLSCAGGIFARGFPHHLPRDLPLCGLQPVHLSAVFGFDWCTRRGDVFPIAEFIDLVPHYKVCLLSRLLIFWGNGNSVSPGRVPTSSKYMVKPCFFVDVLFVCMLPTRAGLAIFHFLQKRGFSRALN